MGIVNSFCTLAVVVKGFILIIMIIIIARPGDVNQLVD